MGHDLEDIGAREQHEYSYSLVPSFVCDGDSDSVEVFAVSYYVSAEFWVVEPVGS